MEFSEIQKKRINKAFEDAIDHGSIDSAAVAAASEAVDMLLKAVLPFYLFSRVWKDEVECRGPGTIRPSPEHIIARHRHGDYSASITLGDCIDLAQSCHGLIPESGVHPLIRAAGRVAAESVLLEVQQECIARVKDLRAIGAAAGVKVPAAGHPDGGGIILAIESMRSYARKLEADLEALESQIKDKSAVATLMAQELDQTQEICQRAVDEADGLKRRLEAEQKAHAVTSDWAAKEIATLKAALQRQVKP